MICIVWSYGVLGVDLLKDFWVLSVGKLGSGFVKSVNWIGVVVVVIVCSVFCGGIYGGM